MEIQRKNRRCAANPRVFLGITIHNFPFLRGNSARSEQIIFVLTVIFIFRQQHTISIAEVANEEDSILSKSDVMLNFTIEVLYVLTL